MPQKSQTSLYIVLVLVGVVLGATGYGLTTYFMGVSISESQAEDIQSGDGYKVVDTSYTIPNIGSIEELEGGVVTEVPEDVAIQLPVAVTSDAYIAAFNELLNTANKLEVQLRDRLPKAMFALQQAGESGDLTAAFEGVLTAREENELAQKFNQDFLIAIGEFEKVVGDADTMVINPSRLVVTNARVAHEAAADMTAHVETLAVPKPPTQESLDALGPLATGVDTSFQGFARSVQDTYSAIKSASQQ